MVRANDRLSRHWDQASEWAQECTSKMQDEWEVALDHHPLEMTLVAFGAGLAVGAGIGLLMMGNCLRSTGGMSTSSVSEFTRLFKPA